MALVLAMCSTAQAQEVFAPDKGLTGHELMGMAPEDVRALEWEDLASLPLADVLSDRDWAALAATHREQAIEATIIAKLEREVEAGCRVARTAFEQVFLYPETVRPETGTSPRPGRGRPDAGDNAVCLRDIHWLQYGGQGRQGACDRIAIATVQPGAVMTTCRNSSGTVVEAPYQLRHDDPWPGIPARCEFENRVRVSSIACRLGAT